MAQRGESPGPDAVHHCEECGYELTGLGEAGSCPECSTPFNCWVPFRLGRPVPWHFVAFQMCGPAAIAACGTVIAARLSSGWWGMTLCAGVLSFLWIVLTVVYPREVAATVAERRWTRLRRRVPRALLMWAGILLNFLILVVLILLVAR